VNTRYASSRAVATVLLGALVLGFQSAPAIADSRIVCESRNYQYSYCRADVRGARVSMVRELSRGRLCKEGYGWGTDRRGIWVDRGCRAEFEIRERGRDRDRDRDRGVEIGAGAAVGLFLGAMIANSKSEANQAIPSWAIGTFQGYNGSLGEDVTLVINPDGVVQEYTRMGEVRGNWIPGSSQINVGDLVYNVTQEANGVRTVQVSAPSNIVSYRRMR
jgi:hypothetical protein